MISDLHSREDSLEADVQGCWVYAMGLLVVQRHNGLNVRDLHAADGCGFGRLYVHLALEWASVVDPKASELLVKLFRVELDVAVASSFLDELIACSIGHSPLLIVG